MRLTDFCNRLPSRAPCGPFDSRSRPLPRAVWRRLVSFERGLTVGRSRAVEGLGACPSAYPMSQPGGASLDGEPPASASAATVTRRPEGRLECVVQRGPGGAPIDGSSALHLPAAAFSTARRDCDPASDVLCRARGGCGDRIPITSGHQARLCRPLVKGGGVRRTRTPSVVRVLPPPVGPGARASCPWDQQEPVTGVAARVLVAFATATRLPTPLHPLSSHASACEPAG